MGCQAQSLPSIRSGFDLPLRKAPAPTRLKKGIDCHVCACSLLQMLAQSMVLSLILKCWPCCLLRAHSQRNPSGPLTGCSLTECMAVISRDTKTMLQQQMSSKSVATLCLMLKRLLRRLQGVRIDYALCSPGLLDKVSSCEVLSDLPPKWCAISSNTCLPKRLQDRMAYHCM